MITVNYWIIINKNFSYRVSVVKILALAAQLTLTANTHCFHQ